MKKATVTLCALLMGAAVSAQRVMNTRVAPADPATPVLPVSDDFQDFSRVDSISYERYLEREKYRVPHNDVFEDWVWQSHIYLDPVLVPDWSKIPNSRDSTRNNYGPLTFSGDTAHHLPNQFLGDAAYIYFQVGSHELFDSDTADIKTFGDFHINLRERGMWNNASQYDDQLRFTIVARSDKQPWKGFDKETSDHKDFVLSGMRGLSIASVLNQYFPDAEVEMRAFGNANPLHEHDKDKELTPYDYAEERVGRLIPGKTAMGCALDEVKADYTIIDASYSIEKLNGHGYSPLEIIKLHSYENSNVFFFSDRKSAWEEQEDGSYKEVYNHINKHDQPVLLPQYKIAFEAETPLKEVMLFLSYIANPGTSFRFITDGGSTPPPNSLRGRATVQYNHIIEVAKERDITFSFIGVGPYNNQFKYLKNVANMTGGQTYFNCDERSIQSHARRVNK